MKTEPSQLKLKENIVFARWISVALTSQHIFIITTSKCVEAVKYRDQTSASVQRENSVPRDFYRWALFL